jgi:hypothetical protein
MAKKLGTQFRKKFVNVAKQMNDIAVRANSPYFIDGLDFVNKNTKMLGSFQAAETWTSKAGTQAFDTTNYIFGSRGLKISEDDNSSNIIYSSRESISIDMTKLDNGATSTTADKILVAFYCQDITKILKTPTNGILLYFSADATVGGNNFNYSITDIVDGWNYKLIPKSSFSQGGTVDWGTIQSIAVAWYTNTNAQNAYVTFGLLCLVAATPTL